MYPDLPMCRSTNSPQAWERAVGHALYVSSSLVLMNNSNSADTHSNSTQFNSAQWRLMTRCWWLPHARAARMVGEGSGEWTSGRVGDLLGHWLLRLINQPTQAVRGQNSTSLWTTWRHAVNNLARSLTHSTWLEPDPEHLLLLLLREAI